MSSDALPFVYNRTQLRKLILEQASVEVVTPARGVLRARSKAAACRCRGGDAVSAAVSQSMTPPTLNWRAAWKLWRGVLGEPAVSLHGHAVQNENGETDCLPGHIGLEPP